MKPQIPPSCPINRRILYFILPQSNRLFKQTDERVTFLPKKIALSEKTMCYSTCNHIPQIAGGQSLCKKSTSGWTGANVFYGVGRSPKRQKYVQLLSRTACGRCNRYCPMKLSITTLLPNHPEGNLFAESPPLDGDFCWLSQSWQTQSDKDGQARKCPEQRVDAATDIARQIALFFTLDQIYLSPSKPIFSSAPCNLPLNNHL